MGPRRRFDVFLSYNSADRPAVERIAQLLRAQRIEPWWDRWNLVPGGSWQADLAEGLNASGACAVLVGPAGLGDWAREELAVAQDRAAKDRAFRLFLVLLPGAPELSDPSLAFLRTRTWVDLRAGVADREGLEDLLAAITGTPRRREVPVAPQGTPPYRGLAAFEEEHAEFFLGRDHDIALVVERLKAGRFLAVLGPSGSGKSSLLRAGLIPALRRGALAGSDAWAIRVFTPGPRPLTTLAAQLSRLFPQVAMQQTLDQLSEDQRSLDLAVSVALAERPPDERVLLIVDQFEEVFTLCGDEDERQAFLTNLLYAAAIPGGRVVVVLGMRADFYQRCAPYPNLRALVADQQFLVGPLDAEALRQVIEEPAWRVGLELEPGLVETIVDDVEDRPGALPLLEHVLLELWQRRQGTMLTLKAYVDSGGVEGALAKRANAIYSSLAPARQDIARRVLLRLVQPGEGAEDTRRRAEMAELVTNPQEHADVEAVLGALADQRLLTAGRDEFSGARVVDITHEALIRGWPELRAWINDAREALRAQRHLTQAATEWHRSGRREEDLYGGARLAYWKERDLGELSDRERAFVAASGSREAREHAAGRRRVRLALGGVMAAITTVAVVALVGLQQVTNQRDVARSRQLAATAAAVLAVDPEQSLRLAMSAFDVKHTQEAESALRQAVLESGSRVAVLRGHEGLVGGAAFTPDGKHVASAGQDGTVRVWDWLGEAEQSVLRRRVGTVWSVDFSPDGKYLVFAGEEEALGVWDWAAGTEPVALEGHDGIVFGASFSPDGRHVLSAGTDSTVRVWEWASGAEPVVLRGHRGNTYRGSFSPNGRHVVSSAEDGTVRVWDWAVGRELVVLRGHTGIVYGTAFSPDGSRVLSGGADGTVRVWELATGAELTVLRGHQGVVYGVGFSPNGRHVVSAGADSTVQVWDWATGGESIVLRGHLGGAAFAAAFSPDGTRVVSAGADSTVRVWDWATRARSTVLRGHQGVVPSVAFSFDSNRVLSAGQDGTVRVWDPVAGSELRSLAHPEGFVGTAAFSSDGHRVATGGVDAAVRIWDWDTEVEPTVLLGHKDDVLSVAFSPDGSWVVSSSYDGTVRVWDVANGAEQKVLHRHEGIVNRLVFSPDGNRVASAGADGTVLVWDVRVGGTPTTLRGHRGNLGSVAFSPDGNRVVSAGFDGSLKVWDLATGAPPTVLGGHESLVFNAAFTADGDRLVSAGADGTVRVWDWRRRKVIYSLRAPIGTALTAAFSPDATRVVSSGPDGTLRVWNCTACGPIESVLAEARARLSEPSPR